MENTTNIILAVLTCVVIFFLLFEIFVNTENVNRLPDPPHVDIPPPPPPEQKQNVVVNVTTPQQQAPPPPPPSPTTTIIMPTQRDNDYRNRRNRNRGNPINVYSFGGNGNKKNTGG